MTEERTPLPDERLGTAPPVRTVAEGRNENGPTEDEVWLRLIGVEALPEDLPPLAAGALEALAGPAGGDRVGQTGGTSDSPEALWTRERVAELYRHAHLPFGLIPPPF